MSEFYVGYVPKAPAGLRSYLRRIVVLLGVIALAVAGVLVGAQGAFPPAAFEFLEDTTFEGTIEEVPYPALLVSRPGGLGTSRYLLVGVGKHGAEEARGRHGQAVTLRGKLIYRDDQTMIELVTGTIRSTAAAAAAARFEDLGPATLTGEIVDTKCYTGVMNPGQGKVHRECAARCISGGIPPGFLVRTAGGPATVYLLAGASGEPLSKQLLPSVGEPITLSGVVRRSGDTLYLRLEPNQIYPRQRKPPS